MVVATRLVTVFFFFLLFIVFNNNTSGEANEDAVENVSKGLENLLSSNSQISEFDMLENNHSTPIQIKQNVQTQSTTLDQMLHCDYTDNLNIGCTVTVDEGTSTSNASECSIESNATGDSTQNEIFTFDHDETLPQRLQKRIEHRRLNLVELTAQQYANTSGFDVQKTIDHWKTRGVNKDHFVYGTTNKKVKKLANESATGRCAQNIDIMGVQRNETFTVNLPDGSSKILVNDRFERHPFAIGEKILLPEPSEPNNHISVGTVIAWTYDVDQKKFYYILQLNDQQQNDKRQTIEYPECRIFKKFDQPRNPDSSILQLKGYTLVSCRRFKRTNVMEVDSGEGDTFMVAFQDKEYYGWYGLWQIDEYGYIVHQDLNLVMYAYYEQMRVNDAVQKSYMKIGVFPMKYTKDADQSKKIQKVIDRINEPTKFDICFLRRTSNKCRRYGGLHKLLVDQQIKLRELLVKLQKCGYNLTKYDDVLQMAGPLCDNTTFSGTCNGIVVETSTLTNVDEVCPEESVVLQVGPGNSTVSQSAPVIESDTTATCQTDTRRISFLEAQLNQLQFQLDVQNQRIQKGEAEMDKISKEGKSSDFGVSPIINETLMALHEEIDENFIQVNDLPRLFRKIEKMIVARIGTLVEDLCFDSGRQIGLAIRIYNETGRIIDGFEDVVTHYMNVDLESLHFLGSNERDQYAVRGRILEPSNKNIIMANVCAEQIASSASTDSTNDTTDTTNNGDVRTGSVSPLPGTSTRSPGIPGRVLGRLSSSGEVAVTIDRDEVKRFLINKIIKSNNVPFEKKHLEDLDEQTLSAISQMCSPVRNAPNTSGQQTHTPNGRDGLMTPVEEMSPIDLDLSAASPLNNNDERTPRSATGNMDVDSPYTPRRVHISPDPDYEPPSSWAGFSSLNDSDASDSLKIIDELKRLHLSICYNRQYWPRLIDKNREVIDKTYLKVSPNITRNATASNADGLLLRSGNVVHNSPNPGPSSTHNANTRAPRQVTRVRSKDRPLFPSPQSLSEEEQDTDFISVTNRRRCKTSERRIRKAFQRQRYLESQIEKCKNLNLGEPVRLLEKEKNMAIKTIHKNQMQLMSIRHESHTYDGAEMECPECANSSNQMVTPPQAQRRLNVSEEIEFRNQRAPERRANVVRPRPAARPTVVLDSSSDEQILVVEERRKYTKKKDEKKLKSRLWETCRNSRKRARFQDSSGSTTTPERGHDSNHRADLANFRSPYELNRGTTTSNRSGQRVTSENVGNNGGGTTGAVSSGTTGAASSGTIGAASSGTIGAASSVTTGTASSATAGAASSVTTGAASSATAGAASSGNYMLTEEETWRREEDTLLNQLLYGYSQTPTSTETSITQTPTLRNSGMELVGNRIEAALLPAVNESGAVFNGLSIENPTAEMLTINRGVVNFEEIFAKNDRRCIRFITRAWRDSDLEVVAERAGLFNWRCTRRLIAGRLGKLKQVKTRVDLIDLNAEDMRDIEEYIKFGSRREYLVGIWQWMLVLFPPPKNSDTIDKRYYLTRIRDKVQSNCNSEKFRIRTKQVNALTMPRLDLTEQFLQVSSPSSEEN